MPWEKQNKTKQKTKTKTEVGVLVNPYCNFRPPKRFSVTGRNEGLS